MRSHAEHGNEWELGVLSTDMIGALLCALDSSFRWNDGVVIGFSQ